MQQSEGGVAGRSPGYGAAAEDLSRVHLFRGVGREAYEGYLERLRVLDLAAGEVLLSAQERNSNLFVLLQGMLRVHLGGRPEAPLLTIQPGECVGELSLLDGGLTTAQVVADCPSRVLCIDQETLWCLINASHAVARNLLLTLSGRVRYGAERIVDALDAQRHWHHFATVDALTGLRNRRWWDEVLPRQVDRCCRDGRLLSCLVMDVDYFKAVNDRFGHMAGDEVLRAIGALLTELLRPSDLAARYGGEEFVVLLPDTDGEAARAIAERLCAAARGLSLRAVDGTALPPITVSVGMATLASDKGGEGAALLAAADAALYRAKRGGRDRVAW